MNNLKKIFLKIWDEFFINVKAFNIRRESKLLIMTVEDTIEYIKRHKCSISRYGDGEFDIMIQKGEPNFQKRNPELSLKLIEVFKCSSSNLLICLPQTLIKTRGLNSFAKKFWNWWAIQKQNDVVYMIKNNIDINYRFGNAYVSRPYSAYRSRKFSKNVFTSLKQLWNDLDILIVEGERTCLGVGNDLFNNTRSIKRILAPSTNAFDLYDKIKESVIENWNNELVILALGPTATILAYDLSQLNIQALDLGHIDIQYEWYLKGQSYVQVDGKFTNESKNSENIIECDDLMYKSSIIDRIY